MNKIRDVIRYRLTTELSERQIAQALGISRTVVARILAAYRASGLTWAEVPQMADSALEEQLTRACARAHTA
ncbi:MAG: helix-turn-helix domain-containing protein [Spirochaetes bacterium]|nr:helix-turn-helix domain-containing protein [Spirochaetota bacterium]